MDRQAFFEKYGIEDAKFTRLNITWDELTRIYNDYSKRLHVLEETAKKVADRLNAEKSVHSIKYRVKDREHLIEKIIRKMALFPGFEVNLGNYRTQVKDLIGVRALHLFKENWADIHRFLKENWEFDTPPKANYKKGDPPGLLAQYSGMGCQLHEHRHGYRSVHYHLLARMGGRKMIVEVQVRTLFEDAWSEIDHHCRYGPNKEDPQAEPYLGVLNNITSNADALASHIHRLQARGAEAALAPALEGSVAGAPGEAAPGGGGGGAAAGQAGDGSQGLHNVREIYKKARLSSV
jgi:ppGpp synthetase/RelA/SpoT-type nucleotidyltranferase